MTWSSWEKKLSMWIIQTFNAPLKKFLRIIEIPLQAEKLKLTRIFNWVKTFKTKTRFDHCKMCKCCQLWVFIYILIYFYIDESDFIIFQGIYGIVEIFSDVSRSFTGRAGRRSMDMMRILVSLTMIIKYILSPER